MLSTLPVVLCLARPFLPLHPLVAQARYRVTEKETWFYQQPGGKRLAHILGGVELASNDSQPGWRSVVLDGWIFASSVGTTQREGFDVAVIRAPEENVRSSPAGALVARVPHGFLLSKVGEQRRWMHVQRTGWVQSSAVERTGQDTTLARLPPGRRLVVNPPDSSAGTVDSSAAQPSRRTTVYRAPEGPTAGMIAPTLPVRVLSRSGEWTRVQFEGWVKTADLQTVTPGVLVGITSAELRADPQRYVGQSVRWTLQFIAVEKSDEMRPDIPNGATYLLTRGPLPERGFVYVIVPDGRRDSVASLVPLSRIEVIARVRSGRSRYLGNPVVELLTMEAHDQP